MRLTTVRPGDIVRADDLHGIVLRKERGKVVVQGICSKAIRHVRSDEISQHWRAAGRRTTTTKEDR